MKKFLAIVAFAAALVVLPLHAADSANSHQRSITTMGTVEVTIPADSAKLTISISALEQTQEDSNTRLDATFKALMAELKTLGIPQKSVIQGNRDTRKKWNDSNSKGGGRMLLYNTSATVIILVEDITKLNPLLAYFKLHEEYDTSSPILYSSKINAEKKAALATALRAARDKAETIAKEGGAKLGALLTATEEEVRANGSYSIFTGNAAINDNLGDAINGSQLYSLGSAVSNNDESNNDTPAAAIPTGQHVLTINARLRATFALE